jgi:glycine amidinotransferase/scyllo-inosamine-4-phosphate amidinotransferase 1
MRISSHNEWDPLVSVVVGSALGAYWPPELATRETTWTRTPIPRGPVSKKVIRETQAELDLMCKILHGLGIKVHRPDYMDFRQRQGLYNYCPRDRLLVVGETVIVPNMAMSCRNQEVENLDFILQHCNDVRWMPQRADMFLDAANVARLGNKLIVLENKTGSPAAIKWLRDQLPDHEIETWSGYRGSHIDSTIIPLREGLVLLNASRITPENCPRILNDWEKIWVNDCVERKFTRYPYATKWIGINLLVIDPHCVIMDSLQTDLIQQLEQRQFHVIPFELTHSRTLGGGHHCVTLDLERDPGRALVKDPNHWRRAQISEV